MIKLLKLLKNSVLYIKLQKEKGGTGYQNRVSIIRIWV